MPPILNAQGVSKRFGADPLFQNISFAVDDGDRIGLIGPNGAGKSTLLAVLAGEMGPDAGEMAVRRRARVAYVHQISTFAPGDTVRSVLENAMIQADVPAVEREQRLRETLGRAGFVDEAGTAQPGMDAEAASLSGGWKKRLAIAEQMAVMPDVLLLDEPTNHLDLEGIEWLEGVLRAARFASVIVTHDRQFLENVATQVVELNRVYAEGLLRVRGAYSRFLEERAGYLESQTRMQESLRNRVRTEIEWLRRGPKARATKAKARIDTAHAMIARLADVDARTRSASTAIDFAGTGRQTKRLLELDQVSVTLGGREIVAGVSVALTNGMRLGLVGPNGSGKTTLLRVMRGELAATRGDVKRANLLRIVSLSQMREIDETLTLRRALAPDSDAVVYRGRVVHVASFAAQFLFTGEQLNQPVSRLSGGERARVLVACLMLQEADVLMLDEPTNDLDIPTLEILEDALTEFEGALVLVTHDRYLLDRVTNVVLGLDGRGSAALFADIAQWEEWKTQQAAGDVAQGKKPAASAEPMKGTKKKLSYMEQREFDAIEERIDAVDARVAEARDRIDDPAIASDASMLTAAIAELEAAQSEHDAAYARWHELSEKAG
jgi:ATP-binding cassette subfamily F protein uup